MVAFSWIFATLLSSPGIYIYDIIEVPFNISNGNEVCSTISLPYKPLDQLYWGLEIYYLYLVPFVVIIFCYVGILIHVIKLKRIGEPSSTENPKESRLYEIKMRASRLALVVVTMFLVCWLPLLVAFCLRFKRGSAFVHRTSVTYEVALFMAYVNEALNPIIYGYFDSFFNKKLHSVVSDQCSCIHGSFWLHSEGHVTESTGEQQGRSAG